MVTLCDAPNANKKKRKRLDSQVASDAKDNALLPTVVKDHRSNNFCVTAVNSELRMKIIVMGSASLSGLSALGLVKSCHCTSVAWNFIVAQWMTSKSICNKGRGQHASRSVETARFSINLTASLRDRNVKRCPSRYGRRISTAQIMARHSCCMVSYCCAVLVSERHQ